MLNLVAIILELNGRTCVPSINLIGILYSNYLNFVHLNYIILQQILEYTEKKKWVNLTRFMSLALIPKNSHIEESIWLIKP